MLKVVQCWDDGVYNDIRLTELLRKYGAKATFNLNPGNMRDEHLHPRWQGPGMRTEWDFHGFRPGHVGKKHLREVYGGFKVASHCWQHELATDGAERFRDAAVKAKEYLEDVFGTACPGFAWPCAKCTPETIAMLRDAGFKYGRGVGCADRVTECPDPLVLIPTCHYMDWKFYQYYEEAKKKDGIFYFWGHSYEMMDYEPLWQQLEDKIRYISEDPDSEWADVIDIVPLCH